MVFIIGLFTVVMVLDCLILVFLVLIQLPKKEAGAGLAFGAGATDALFGAGSGTVLTKITKYAATIFFVLAIVLSVMQNSYHNRTTKRFTTKLAAPGAPLPTAIPANTPPSTVPAAVPSTNAAGSNTLQLESATNPPVTPTPPATNTP